MNNKNNFLSPLGPITNASSQSLAENSGTLPSPIDAIRDLFQQMTVTIVSKAVSGSFLVQESANNINFYGMWQPASGRNLAMTKNGQRAWKTHRLWTDISVILKPDDVVVYLGTQYRVLSVQDWKLHSYMEYSLMQDFEGSGPYPTPG